MHANASATPAAEINENEYDFHKLLATMIGTAGVNLVAKMDDPCGTGSSSDNGSMLRAFLSIALVLMAHPSIEISTEVLSAWSQLLERTPEVLQSHHVVVLREPLLRILTIKLRKWGSPDDNDRSGLVSEYGVRITTIMRHFLSPTARSVGESRHLLGASHALTRVLHCSTLEELYTLCFQDRTRRREICCGPQQPHWLPCGAHALCCVNRSLLSPT